MNKAQLKFLLKLNTQITVAAEILETDRPNLMPAMDHFFKVVSLGMEIGMTMKPGKPATAKAATPPTKKSDTGKAGHTIVTNMIKVMGTKTMNSADVATLLRKAKLAPKSKNLRNYINMVLSDSPKVFKRVSRGLYMVRANAKSAVVKAKTNGQSHSKQAKKATAKATAAVAPVATSAAN